MQAPLGLAVIGGLVMSTFATLLVLPSVFAVIIGGKVARSPSIYPDDPDSVHYDPQRLRPHRRDPQAGFFQRRLRGLGQASRAGGNQRPRFGGHRATHLSRCLRGTNRRTGLG